MFLNLKFLKCAKTERNRGDTDDDLPLPIILLLKTQGIVFGEQKRRNAQKEKVSYEVKKTQETFRGEEEHDEEKSEIS